jgi:hypothetical protein
MRSVPQSDVPESPFLWAGGIAARETLRYLDKNGIDAEPLLSSAGLSRSQLSQERRGVRWTCEKPASFSTLRPRRRRSQRRSNTRRDMQSGDIVVVAKMDRMFRSALDAVQTIESFKHRKVSLWLLDLGNDCSGNGISELRP